MKKLMMIFAFTLSLHSLATPVVKEYDHSEEVKCYNEMKAQGCVNNEGVEKAGCMDKKISGLSAPCQSMHLEKKKK